MDGTVQHRYLPLQGKETSLQQTRVAIVGLGGIGSHVAEGAARMGIGNIDLIDDDVIEASNLSRQGIYTTLDAEAGRKKGEVAQKRIHQINPDSQVRWMDEKVTARNIHSFWEHHPVDILMDGTDCLEARYTINDYAYEKGIPWIYGAVIGSTSLVAAFGPGIPCFRCQYGHTPAEEGWNCQGQGVILPAALTTASMQLRELLRWASGHPISGKEWRTDNWNGHTESLDLRLFQQNHSLCQEAKERIL